MTCLLILMTFVFDMYIDTYIVHVYYVSSYHVVVVVVVWFIKCIMSMLMIKIIDDLCVFELI
jgi:hypothetical protein